MLAAIIGQECRSVPGERAFDVTADYTIGQEESVRGWQHHAATPTAGKKLVSDDDLGPWMVTLDESEPTLLDLTTSAVMRCARGAWGVLRRSSHGSENSISAQTVLGLGPMKTRSDFRLGI